MIRFVDETGSTNADLLALGDAAREGEWLVARRQMGGRGRAGRAWEDGAGNFMGSTVVGLAASDPPAHTLALVTGLAAHDAVAAVLNPPDGLLLKWPNDVLLQGAKLAGILLERAGERLVVGEGAKLARAPAVPGRTATALATHGAAVSADAFAERLAWHFAARLADWRGGGWPRLRSAWLARAHPLGTPLEVRDPAGAPIRGAFAGLAEDGAALLRLADGTVRAIHAGDIEMVSDATGG
jgi:BirA family transcriptional regulator, biotin operon repressor / biotin---[acetyl-CoA-carboxylase] ligase